MNENHDLVQVSGHSGTFSFAPKIRTTIERRKYIFFSHMYVAITCGNVCLVWGELILNFMPKVLLSQHHFVSIVTLVERVFLG